MHRRPRFSVIVLARNEAGAIGRCVQNLRQLDPEAELIVADGMSTDGTVDIALRYGARVCATRGGRGAQCNLGARQANGDILLFLHADTTLPPNSFALLESYFRDEGVKIGTFCLAFDVGHRLLDLYATASRLNFTPFRFGDHGIVVRRAFLESLGGFREYPIFEDLELLLRASRRSHVRLFPAAVTTSARRFLEGGVFRQQVRNAGYILQYLLGVSTWRLTLSYDRQTVRAHSALIIFARYPRPGMVKTRLAAALGHDFAARFYRRCAGHILSQAGRLPDSVRPYLFFADGSDGRRVRGWAGRRFFFAAQGQGDLGERMEAAFRLAFSHGARKAVVIGTDIPDLSAEVINAAFEALDRSDAVIGPTPDGGYYLLGIRRPCPAVFHQIAWSTAAVYPQTVAAIKDCGLTLEVLPALTDIDTAEDLARWSQAAGKRHPRSRLYQKLRLEAMSNSFEDMLPRYGLAFRAQAVHTLQLNITRRCNQACWHCHLNCSPGRTELMARPVMERCLEILRDHSQIETVDITGGAPELHPDFDYLVEAAASLGKHVIVRHNLTVAIDGDPATGQLKAHLPGFFAANKVEVIASLPHFQAPETDRQRGESVFYKSIEQMRRLNELGFGTNGLVLNLAHNPPGISLPVEQCQLEPVFRHELASKHGVFFNRLYAIANMPLGRYRSYLRRTGQYDAYLSHLASAFNPSAAQSTQCRSLVSVAPDGQIYDCDFNQAPELAGSARQPMTVFDFDLDALKHRRIHFGPHCFGCTAGAGSG